jgi:protein SCO1/2
MALRRLTLVVAAVALGVLAGFVLLRAGEAPHDYVGTLFADPDPAPQFELTADSGDRGGLEPYRGKVVLLYFGYTFCPDICPASLAELATAVETLDADSRDDVQVVMISVDPERDTPELLAAYMDHFNPSFVGFTGSVDEIAEVAASYNVFYQAQEGTPATGYLVDHWAGVYLIDRDGLLVESFGFGTTGEQMAADVVEWL